MPRLFVKARLGKFVDQLVGSIKAKTQTVLKNYHSANSNEIRDRLVEPIHFGDNYQSIIALDTQDQVCKQFKLDRIGDIIEMDKPFAYESLHKKNQTDIFGMTGDSVMHVTLSLSLRAYLLLREEYPLSIPYTTKENESYTFHGPVSNPEGVARFILGLLDEITIVEPTQMKDFIAEKIRNRKS
jgi:predicted DNA-binding transcriptional regulator YafY